MYWLRCEELARKYFSQMVSKRNVNTGVLLIDCFDFVVFTVCLLIQNCIPQLFGKQLFDFSYRLSTNV